MPLQIRRGTEEERENLVTPPADGELLWVTNDRKLYIGNGTTLAKDLVPVTGFDDDDAQDAIGDLFAAGTHGNITFVYDNVGNSLSATVELDEYVGTIGATSVNAQILGALVGGNNFVLFDNTANEINLDGIVASSIVPTNNDVFDLGAEAVKFRDIHLSNSVRIGSAAITTTGDSINLPAGSTLGGIPLGTGDLVEGSNYRINIVAEDSSLLVDSVNGTLRGNVVSPVDDNIIINVTQKSATLQEIILQAPGVISGNPVFLSDITSIVSSNPSATEPIFAVAATSNTNVGGSISLTRARGEATAPIIVENGDNVGSLEYGAFVGTGFVSLGGLTGIVDGAVVPGQPSQIKLDLELSNGTTIVKAMTFKPTQVEFTAIPIIPNLTTVARNELTPQFGMMIYNTTDNKFQGYQNVNGDTPGWVDLS